MQQYDPENNPANVKLPESEFVEHISSIFRHLRNYNYLSLRDPADAIYIAGQPFTRDIKSDAEVLETAYFNAASHTALKNDSHANEIRKEMFATTLRAYVFSGTRINPVLIHMTADYVNASQKEVQEAIRPNADFIHRQDVHKQDRKHVRYLGYEALKQLDLVPFYGKRLMRLLDY